MGPHFREIGDTYGDIDDGLSQDPLDGGTAHMLDIDHILFQDLPHRTDRLFRDGLPLFLMGFQPDLASIQSHRHGLSLPFTSSSRSGSHLPPRTAHRGPS